MKIPGILIESRISPKKHVDSLSGALYIDHSYACTEEGAQAMKTADEIRSILADHKDELGRRFGVREIAVFGSVARGEQMAASDVDILVDFRRPIGLEFTDLAEYIERLLGIRVDLVPKGAVKPRLMHLIESELLYV